MNEALDTRFERNADGEFVLHHSRGAPATPTDSLAVFFRQLGKRPLLPVNDPELEETLAHLINARVLGYIDQEYFEDFYDLIRQAEKALNGYISYVRKQHASAELYGSRTAREEAAGYMPIDEATGHTPIEDDTPS